MSVLLKPSFTWDQIREALSVHYDIERAVLESIPSGHEQVIIVSHVLARRDGECATSDKVPQRKRKRQSRMVVLRIRGKDGLMDLREQAQMHIQTVGQDIQVPRVLPAHGGSTHVSKKGRCRRETFDAGKASAVDFTERMCWLRLETFIPGETLARYTPQSPPFLRSYGRFLGRLSTAMASFKHPAVKQMFEYRPGFFTRLCEEVRRLGDDEGNGNGDGNGDDAAAAAEAYAAVSGFAEWIEQERAFVYPLLRTGALHGLVTDNVVIVSPKETGGDDDGGGGDSGGDRGNGEDPASAHGHGKRLKLNPSNVEAPPPPSPPSPPPAAPASAPGASHAGASHSGPAEAPHSAASPFDFEPKFGITEFCCQYSSYAVDELAIGAAYAMLGKRDPLEAARHVLEGFHLSFPLTEKEIWALFGLIVHKVCAKLKIDADNRARLPEGRRRTPLAQLPSWKLLMILTDIHPQFAFYYFRSACGDIPPCPRNPPIVKWLRANRGRFAHVLGRELSREAVHVFDCSVSSPEMAANQERWIADPVAWGDWASRQVAAAGATVGVGRYDEARAIYSSSDYDTPKDGMPERRTVHLGMDLFCPAGTPVFAPLEGTVHSFRDNATPFDYGPCLILEHRVDLCSLLPQRGAGAGGDGSKGRATAPREGGSARGAPHGGGGSSSWQGGVSGVGSYLMSLLGLSSSFSSSAPPPSTAPAPAAAPASPSAAASAAAAAAAPSARGGGAPAAAAAAAAGPGGEGASVSFYTLYGHLSRESLRGKARGQRVARGERLGALGDARVNGGWPPHLHFQLTLAMLGRAGDFPGVAAPCQAAVWRSLCPDPNLILGIPAGAFLEQLPPVSARAALPLAARHLVGDPSVPHTPQSQLGLVAGKGQYLYDDCGRQYLDAVNSAAHVGHCHPAVVRAAQRQMDLLGVNPAGQVCPAAAELAQRLCTTLPAPLSVCLFTRSGSEAHELALRVARVHTRRQGVIVVGPSSDHAAGAASAGGPSFLQTVPVPKPFKEEREEKEGATPAAEPLQAGEHSRAEKGEAGEGEEGGRSMSEGALAAERVREAVERASSAEGGPGVAAFVCEAVLGRAGHLAPGEGYLAAAYEHTRQAGGVCIADETQVGLGRLGGAFWGFQMHALVPDVVVVGDALGNGHPLGAVVCTPALAASFARAHGSSSGCGGGAAAVSAPYGGDPVACAVGLAVLDAIQGQGLQASARGAGAELLEELQGDFFAHGVPVSAVARGRGLFIGVELLLNRGKESRGCRSRERPPAPRHAEYVARRMAELGVLVGIGGPDRNVLQIKPPLVFTTADAKRLLEVLKVVLKETPLQIL